MGQLAHAEHPVGEFPEDAGIRFLFQLRQPAAFHRAWQRRTSACLDVAMARLRSREDFARFRHRSGRKSQANVPCGDRESITSGRVSTLVARQSLNPAAVSDIILLASELQLACGTLNLKNARSPDRNPPRRRRS